jgi:uncharacterized protein YcsI (UPF0317 family)
MPKLGLSRPVPAAPLTRPAAGPTSGLAARRLIRAGRHAGHTVGLAPGFVQGNLVILPAAFAADFALYCQRNPKPCPLLAASEPGDPRPPGLGDDFDVRTDAPRYRVFRDGRLVDEPTDVRALWRDDLVAFVLGCSLSFEEALMADGVPLRHVQLGRNIAMYRTHVPTVPAGPFRGPLVVTMRPFAPQDAIRAIQITSRFPAVHGAPVHLGDPKAIGVQDLAKPDWGDPVPVEAGEIPVFWACGVTPQVAIEAARPDLSITHAPGCMLITDVPNSRLSVL